MNIPIYWPYLVHVLVLYQGIFTNTIVPSENWMSRQFPCDVKVLSHGILFDCKARKLRKVPAGITSNATVINLSTNNIQKIPADAFSHLGNLTELYLYQMNVQGLKNKDIHIDAFKNLTMLQRLELGNNRLDYIPKNLPLSLKWLEVTNNSIVELNGTSFSGLTNLTHLSMYKNCFFSNKCGKPMSISDDSLAALTKLTYLDLSSNNLTRVPKGLPTTLTTLALSDNQIQYIFEEDFKDVPNLVSLTIHGNCPRCGNAPYPCVPCPNGSLGIHPNAFNNLKNLTKLHLAGNSLTELKDSWFENLKELQQLFLSFNLLQNVIQGELKFFNSLSELQTLDIAFNFGHQTYPQTVRLSSNFSKLKSLQTLNLVGLVFREIEYETFRPLFSLTHLTKLNLGTNFIVHSNSTVFKEFPNLNIIVLSENRLYPVSVSTPSPPGYRNNIKGNLFPSPKMMSQSLNSYSQLIKPQCSKRGRVLSLSSNNLFYITPEQFEGYGNIACLNLSKNGFSNALNGTEFSSLPNLTYLDLSHNKIDLAYSNAFQELQKLEVLDISYNEHYFEAYGVTHNLDFVKNLPVLKILNMSNNFIDTLTTKRLQSHSLEELRFGHNKLGTLWKDEKYWKMFMNLTNLTILDISSNNIDTIPNNVYNFLPTKLRSLFLNFNKLTDFNWTGIDNFTDLQILDLSHNSLTFVKRITSPTLKALHLDHNQIVVLSDSLLEIARNLTTLYLNHNMLTTINQTTFLTKPFNYLRMLSLHRNPFQCSCDAMEIIQWIEHNNVTIPRLTTGVYCYVSYSHSQIMIQFEFDQCVNNQLAMLLSILVSIFIIVTTTLATVAHIFYWDTSYVLHYLRARWKGYHCATSKNNAYDIFVTYDTKDPWVSEWVLETLRVKLEHEGEKALPLCLEERDWPLGTPLVDNLTHSIRCSRKTLFVLTKAYAKTGVFRLAMYLAHQRLLDENLDVIVVLMLEPVLQHSHFLRLRRRLCGDSVLEWPRTAAAEPWFWQNLRNVVRVDNQKMYTSTYSQFFTSSRERD